MSNKVIDTKENIDKKKEIEIDNMTTYFLERETYIITDYHLQQEECTKHINNHTQPIHAQTEEEYTKFTQLPIIQNNCPYYYVEPKNVITRRECKNFQLGDLIWNGEIQYLYEIEEHTDNISSNRNKVYKIVGKTKKSIQVKRLKSFNIVDFKDEYNGFPKIGLLIDGIYENDEIINVPLIKNKRLCVMKTDENFIYMYDESYKTKCEEEEAYRRMKYGENYIENYDELNND